MVSHGISGSLVAAAVSPALIRGKVQATVKSALPHSSLEANQHLLFSYLNHGDLFRF